MMNVRRMLAVCAGSCAMALAAPVVAQQQSPELQSPWGIYVEGGNTLEGNSKAGVASAGFTFGFGPRRELWGGVVTTFGDLFVSEWRAQRRSNDRKQNYTQVGIIANARYRFAQGTSPWFADLGIGLTLLDKLYETPDRSFSTRFQFTEVLGIGRSFGDTGAHELQLRVQHVSNAGIKEPNPGETFFKLRYQYHF
ncbi:acyloxyacyl hydrolase [Variovorax humicola]|uniref:Acyloxyacyl hydrolase n=1 Tax=Variovorax humicola TaxID=1769758 RepID=A0ABU8VVW1_9BURK